LIHRIEHEGPITFRDFMQAALYDPELGYYNTERLKIGPQGDFHTSSNVHPAFGALLARAFVDLWAVSNEPLTIVEVGAGTGQLGADVISALRDEHPSTFERLTYIPIDASQQMRTHQRAKLAGFEEHIRWCDLEEIERVPISGIVFSNEFVDALAVHRVRRARGALEESYVAVAQSTDFGRLTLIWDKPSTTRLREYLERTGVALREGQIVEINLDMVDWLARISVALKGGFLITIDYGDTAEYLQAHDRQAGTLRSFHRHRLIDSPVERIGEQDITASVNFTAFIEYSRDFGFEALSYERQAAFLIRMGLIERIAREQSGASAENLQNRLALKNLFVPGGVSDNFRVLIQSKG
jgi:SAM-dependent MidA family methyltransferase